MFRKQNKGFVDIAIIIFEEFQYKKEDAKLSCILVSCLFGYTDNIIMLKYQGKDKKILFRLHPTSLIDVGRNYM